MLFINIHAEAFVLKFVWKRIETILIEKYSEEILVLRTAKNL